MGIDYNAVGGIGVRFNEELQMKAIELEYFTEEEWDEGCKFSCVESLDFYYMEASSYDDPPEFYFLVKGDNLKEIVENSTEFLNKINSTFIVDYKQEDLKLICELDIY